MSSPEQYNLFPEKVPKTPEEKELVETMEEMLSEHAYRNLSIEDPILRERAEERLKFRKSGKPSFENHGRNS